MYTIKGDLTFYIFDFCGTLYKGNTSLLFLKYLLNHSSLSYKIKYFFYWVIAKILKDLKIIGGNHYMNIRVKTLKGLHTKNIKGLVDLYYNDVLQNIEIHETFEFLDVLIKNKKNVIILSNTFNFILDSFPYKPYMSDMIGSEILIENSIVQGQYKKQINQVGKLKVIKGLYSNNDIKNAMFITDNLNADADLYNYVKESVLITI